MNVADTFQLISKVTPARLTNFAKILFGYYLSRIIRKPYVFGKPVSISIEPTTSCNLRCPECPSGKREFTRPTGMLNIDFYINVLMQLHKELMYITFYFQGEPYLNKDFLKMVKLASLKRIYTSTSTNGHYLSKEAAEETVESGLSRLIISIDGTTDEVYTSYRKGGNLSKVIEGAKNIVEAKKNLKSATPHVIFQFLIVKPNEHQVEEVQRLAKEIGVDEVKFKTAQFYDYENGNDLMPEKSTYSRYRLNKNGRYALKNKLFNHCWRLWNSAVITWDGRVVPCCFDKDAKHPVGNLQSVSFKNIWIGKQYNSFRSSVLKARKKIEICKNCTEGTKVWI